MENADVSSPPLSPSLCTFSERFRAQVLRGKSLALDRIPLLLVYPFSGSQTKGFDWSRDTAASICSPCIDVDPPRNLCGRRMGKFRENSEKTNAPPPVLPYLFCLELFTNFAFNLPTHLLFFTRRFLSEFASQCCFINIITALREARLTRVEAAKSLRSGDSPMLDFNEYI